MKKIIHVCAFMVVAIALVSCNKLNDAYNTLGPVPAPTSPAQSITYTLAPADFTLLPTTVYANSAGYFLNTTDANQYVPTILNSKFSTYPNGSSAAITFNIGTPAPSIVLADSVYSTTVFGSQPTGLEYTLVNKADYLLAPGNTFADFSVAQVLGWLPYKYTAPAANQLEVLTWIFYPTLAVTAPQIYPGLSVSTTGTVTTATGSFLYTNGAWVQAYQLTPTQYASIGLGQYNQFTSSNSQASIVADLNGILKSDPSIVANATVGAIQYVSFNYYNSAITPKVTSQRVIALVFNGTNWGTTAATTPATATFTRVNGAWIGDPTVYYTLTTADTKLIAASTTIGSNATTSFASTLANLGSYGDFETTWMSLSLPNPTSFLDQAMILVLTTDFPLPKLNTPYKVTFLYYTGGKDVSTTYGFTYNGTAWVAAQ